MKFRKKLQEAITTDKTSGGRRASRAIALLTTRNPARPYRKELLSWVN